MIATVASAQRVEAEAAQHGLSALASDASGSGWRYEKRCYDLALCDRVVTVLEVKEDEGISRVHWREWLTEEQEESEDDDY